MKLTVFGASGGTGTQLVRQALDAGHEVTAVARESSRLSFPDHPGLTVIRADVRSPNAVGPAVEGRDAVLSALGSTSARTPTDVCAAGVRGILGAMADTGARRLIVVSASGAFTDGGDGPFTRLVAKPLLQRFLRHPFADTRIMEEEIRATADLDWTIVRPPRLTDGPRTGRYRTSLDRNVRGGLTLSRADLADCVLNRLDDPETIRTVVCVGY
ncbi:NAD(P)-dependent oxidoreductase [Streptosporangium sp. CA-135522]|uniref:NAD(P)-dependent oxidoreductase n=1 Tax=Streptosporangium sp. CA-135522 TaxID=3240072 RepID=UPI003D92A3E7